LLADQYSRGEKNTSRDALLVRSKQRESNAASGDASLVPLQKQKGPNVSGDASLIKEQNEQHKLCTSGEVSLVMIKHQQINKITSGEASLVPTKHYQNEVIAIDIPQEVSGTVCKSIEHRFSETVEYHIIDDQLSNSETFETINTCTICSRKIDSVQSPTIFCCRCEGTLHQQCVGKKAECPNEVIEDDDYICPSCRELDMDNAIQHTHLKCIIKYTEAKLERTNENTESHKYRQKKGSRTNNTKTSHVQSSLTQPENYRTEVNMTDSSTGVNPGYDNNTAADETMLKEISNKNKPKKVSKNKDQATQLRQMDEQLVQCKARIVILEDTNRDYKNTQYAQISIRS
jgi:hypothetical protein